MTSGRPVILIVEDQDINRQILRHIISAEYEVIEAENGEVAFERLKERDGISAILLDLIMPVMDGYAFLDKFQGSSYSTIPVIAVTSEKDESTEQKVLDLGAWDFVSKPYQPQVLLLRLKNVITRSQFYLLNEMKFAYEHDSLTGLYNRTKFFDETRLTLNNNPSLKFALVRFDIDQFHLLNSFWGEEEGDSFLRFIADSLRQLAASVSPCTYARISADTFCVCLPYDKERIAWEIEKARERLSAYNKDYLVKPSFGIYVIDHPEEKIQRMYEYAALAAMECKGSYLTYCCYYKPEMSRKVSQEQSILNEMESALEEEQFEVYLQPKYNLRDDVPYGAEALIRWNHPDKGILSPGIFIPIFERNGFIGKTDTYMWEHVCALLREWIDQGLNPAPVSVNVSRVNMYNPNLVELITGLVRKYDISPELLNLEITESAYMDNPEIMRGVLQKLRDAGFLIMMDDFGSGYSSLNTLKDIPFDVLKIDMKFLTDNDDGRNECILASIIHMAGWLKIPVIMEGVETAPQVDFLKSIGCGYVQGFYFARPMPVRDYEELIRGSRPIPAQSLSENLEALVGAIWDSSLVSELLFDSFRQPAAIYEFENDSFHALRVNSEYNRFFGYGEEVGADADRRYPRHLRGSSLETVLAVFRQVVVSKRDASCEYSLISANSEKRYIRMELRYWGANESAKILFALFNEIPSTN